MYVAMDLVTDVSQSNGFMVIVVFEDKLTKMVHLIGCEKEITAIEYARIFIDNVFWLHGLPRVIISNEDPRSFYSAHTPGEYCAIVGHTQIIIGCSLTSTYKEHCTFPK